MKAIRTSDGSIAGELNTEIEDKDHRKGKAFTVDTHGLPSDPELIPLSMEKKVDLSGSAEPSPWSVMLLWFVPMMIFVGVLYFLIFRKMGPGGAR